MTLSNIILKHGYGQVKSRSDINISTCDTKGQQFASPIILSNMPSVQNYDILFKFQKNEWPYIYHRLYGNDDIFEFLKRSNEENWSHRSISIGVQEEDLLLLQKIKDAKLEIDWLTIDVAFIYNKYYIDYIKKVRDLFTSVYLIAGNFTDFRVLQWLKDLGIDCAKFSIGVSNLCRTRQYTGFGTTVKDLIECGQEAQKIGIDLINDGGLSIINEDNGEIALGDIFKALNFGAKWQMSSSLFRWCPELSNVNGEIEQYGNSTARAKGHNKNQEGTIKFYKTNNIPVEKRMQEIKDALQSSVSYSGKTSLDQIYNTVRWEYV